MRKPKLRELREAIRAVIAGPFTTKFPKEPSIPPPNVRYKIEFNPDKCILCGACVQVCPANARAIVDVPDMAIRRNIHYQDACVYCGQCVRYCTTREGIRHTGEYELSQLTNDKFVNEIQGELVFCAQAASLDCPQGREHGLGQSEPVSDALP
jgi:formate hydrogenlyase subunit 6/NADH:ubiquinone oxidoreductase subunit I